MKQNKDNFVGKTGYAVINGKKYFAECINVGRKGFRVKYRKDNPSSCWMANQVSTVREFNVTHETGE